LVRIGEIMEADKDLVMKDIMAVDKVLIMAWVKDLIMAADKV